MKKITKKQILILLIFAVIVAACILGSKLLNAGKGQGSLNQSNTESVTGQIPVDSTGNTAEEELTSHVQSSFSDKEDEVYNRLRSAGISVAGTCGIMGNIRVENPWYDADLSGNNGNTYGLFQFNNDGNRKAKMVQWCNNQVIYPNRIDGQVKYMLYEIQGGDPIADRLGDYMTTVEDPQLAAEEFAAGYERCVGYTRSGDDGIYHGNLYPEYIDQSFQCLQGRMRYAQEYYDVYSGLEGITQN